MADENPLQNLPDVTDVVEEVVTLSKEPKKLVAKKITNAYVQAAIADSYSGSPSHNRRSNVDFSSISTEARR